MSDSRRKLLVLSLLIMLCVGNSSSQVQDETPTFGDSMKELVSFFAPFVFPKIIQDVYQLKAFITSDEFAHVRATRGDLDATDSIFAEAMRLSLDNSYEALLISFIATMDHRRFGVNLPLVGALLWFPLTSEFEDEYLTRVNALPSRLYPDSPQSKTGDRDKLQHFFGSALIAYTFESRSAAQRIGEFIEWGEDKVIVDGALDDRDFRANSQGQDFGLRLLADKHSRPSAFFRFSVVEKKAQLQEHITPSDLPAEKEMEEQ